MNFIRKQWYWLVPLLPAVFVTEKFAYFLSMLYYGDAGFLDSLVATGNSVWEEIGEGGIPLLILGYFFFLAFRIVPFGATSVFCFLAAYKVRRNWLIIPILASWCAILSFTIPTMMSIWSPLFSDERMSSTAVIAFLVIPFIAVPFALGGAAIGLGISYLTSLFFGKPFGLKRELPAH